MKANIGGLELGYEVAGEGPAVLLLHGFPFDRRLWRPTVEALKARFRVIALDLRGFGESQGTSSYSIDELAADAAGLLDHLGIPMAAVVGHSMGGYVALALAAHRPARLSALVLVDSRAKADTAEGKRARDEGIELVRARGVTAYVEPIPGRMMAPGASTQAADRVRALGQAQSAGAIVAALAAMRERPDRTADLGLIRCPTLVVVGAQDPLTPPVEARTIAGAIVGARLAELPGGHLVPLESPGPLAAALDAFLSESL